MVNFCHLVKSKPADEPLIGVRAPLEEMARENTIISVENFILTLLILPIWKDGYLILHLAFSARPSSWPSFILTDR